MNGEQCLTVLKALGELSRLRIMRLLLRERLGVQDIAGRLRISEYNVSKHLRILKESGLLAMDKSGRQHLYSVIPALRRTLPPRRDVLELDCCPFRFDKLPR